MWTSRFELGVRFAFCAALFSAACAEPELNEPTPLDYAADRSGTEAPASTRAPSTRAELDQRRRERERVAIVDLHASSTWFERKRPDAELPNVRWAAQCLIHRACPVPHALPACKEDERAPSWEALRGQANQLSGSVVAISGQLDLSTEVLVRPSACRLGACCHHRGQTALLDNRGSEVELENSEHALGLAGYECSGDDSKGCCNVLADGRAVIAKGRLVATAGRVEWREPLWELRDASLCTLAAAHLAKR